MPVRIIIADDHTILRKGLRLLLEREPDFRVVGEGSDGREAIALADSLHPDIAILDIAMPSLEWYRSCSAHHGR